MKVIYKLASRCTIKSPSSNSIWKLKMLGFVDDKKHYVNLVLQLIKVCLEEAISKSMNMWEELLSFVSGNWKCPSVDFTYYNGSLI